MKIGFHEDHWWIIVNGVKAYRLSIPRDVSKEEARKHATNVLVATVKNHAGRWLIELSGAHFIDAHTKNGWNPTLTAGTYVRRADCAGTLVTILRDVLGLPSPF